MPKKKNILVLGGAGYIGSHAMIGLKKKGHNPVAYDNLSTGHRESVRGSELIEADIADREALVAAIRDNKIDAVMHFAASALVEESVKDPLVYLKNNVVRAVELLDAMVAEKVRFLIFSSSAAVYGVPGKVPIEEDSSTKPINPYGETKLMMEKMMEHCSRAYDLGYVSFRYFNAAGADEDAETGEDHSPETHLIPLVLKAAAGERDRIDIYGTDYDTPDGTCVRDYIHVTDLVDAHILALDHLSGGGESSVFNLGNGKGFSVREVIDSASRVCGKDIPFREAARRPGDPDMLIASSEKAKKELGWSPRFTALDDMIRSAWTWYEKSDASHQNE